MKSQPKDKMIGVAVVNKASANARSSKCNDRERRTLKRANRNKLRLDLRDGADVGATHQIAS